MKRPIYASTWTDLRAMHLPAPRRLARKWATLRMVAARAALLLCLVTAGRAAEFMKTPSGNIPQATERQVTHGRYGHLLTNTGVWSPDSRWVVYDTRSDPAGEAFDGDRIEVVDVEQGTTRPLYQSGNGAHCGVATFHPSEMKVVFILGPEHPGPDWQYCAWHRRGVVVNARNPGPAVSLDARDLVPPFTPGALRGGSHVHVWDAAGQWVSFTYEDHVLARFKEATATNDINQRNVGVSIPGNPVRVPRSHPRNHDADQFTVLVTRTVAYPRAGSDEINRACEEGWVGTNGYARTDGSHQKHALAFQGTVVAPGGRDVVEVFIADLPEDLTQAGDGPLCGTETRAPYPPRGVVQRRLTFTTDRKFPGVQGPRHWLRSSPDGTRIAFLMKDDNGIVQLWTISPQGGSPRQLTKNSTSVSSAFSWSPDGAWLTHTMDCSVCVTDARSGVTTRLTPRAPADSAPRPEACVFSPNGKQIAFVRPVTDSGRTSNQIFVLRLEGL